MGNWIALGLAIVANVGANVAFKYFLQNTDIRRSWSSVGLVLYQPSLWIGLFLGTTLLSCYLYAIKEIPLSIAYTVATSVSIAGVTCAGVFLYGETLGPRAAIGIAIVIVGVVLLVGS